MKVVFKIASKNLISNRNRTLFTLLCVVLSISIIGIVFGISDSLMTNAYASEDPETIRGFNILRSAFVVISCFMSCFVIYTAFSISLHDRIKSIGFLTSVGVSVKQKMLLILTEAAIYGIVGVLIGTFLGFGIGACFFEIGAGALRKIAEIQISSYTIHLKSVLLCVSLGFFTVLTASFFPMLRIRKLSVTETIKDNNQINISLKQTILSKIAEILFGRLGLLAGQNYDNNRIRYRAISLALSGGTTFFFVIYSFFMYPVRYFIEDGIHPMFWDPWVMLGYPVIALALIFVLIFLICSTGCIQQNMEQRKKEFAMYKSMGMQNSELHKMMNIECIFLSLYSIFFGFLGSVAADYFIFNLFIITGTDDAVFYYPFDVFFCFVLLNIVVCSTFALYSRHKISKINIIETIRNN